MVLKLGKLPARDGAVKLKLASYLRKSVLPTPPPSFGHDDLVTTYPMLGNDRAGDCVWAGAAHETQIWTAAGGTPARFTTRAVLSDYATVTGYDPDIPGTDQGTDVGQAMSYRRKTGIVDSHGQRHKIEAYVGLNPGDVQELYTAMWLFTAVGVGIEFPASAMDQFRARQPWDVSRVGTKVEGGHYIPAVGRHGMITVVTWGRKVSMTEAFYKRYADEGVVGLSAEMLRGGRSLEGFDKAALLDDLRNITAAGAAG